VNLDWRRLKAVVLESDDWGLCAWSADAQALRVLAGSPAFRSPAGQRYGGSTLESAADVRAMGELLLEFKGGDGFPPVLQANTVVAAPDYALLKPPLFEVERLPLVDFFEAGPRWARPGLRQALEDVREKGVWCPELHGLHHLPESAWLTALRRGADDARRAHEQKSPICVAVEASGEYDPEEPFDLRRHNLRLAVERFRSYFGRGPDSFCPPDYRWDAKLDADARELGLNTFQGMAERAHARVPRLTRMLHRFRWPNFEGTRFAMPPRIAFEPAGPGDRSRVGADAALGGAREAWGRSQPAAISTHRMNYVHLKPGWADAGRAALRDLLGRLAQEGAVFLTDAEVRSLAERGWSSRPLGANRSLFRYHGVPGEPVRIPAPQGSARVVVRDGGEDVRVEVADGDAEARVHGGTYVLEWMKA
jgi:hypothetical protein